MKQFFAHLRKAASKALHNQRGFTMLEIIVAIAITIILGIGAITIYINVQNYVLETKIKNEQATVLNSITDILQSQLAYAEDGTVTIGSYGSYTYGFSADGLATSDAGKLMGMLNSSTETTLFDATAFNLALTLNFKNYSGADPSSFSAGCVVYVDVTLTNSNGIATTEELAIRLLNYDLHGTTLGTTAQSDSTIGFNIKN